MWPGNRALVALEGGRFASGSDDGSVRLWDPATGDEIILIDVNAPVTSLAVLNGGRLRTVVDKNGHVHLINVLLDVASSPDDGVAKPARTR